MIDSRISGSRPSKLFADPANFLHAIDVEADLAVFFPTSRERLREAAFVDGRSNIATGAPEPARLSELLRAARPEPTPGRFIFHMSFCGSTLLSRLIDVPGHSLVLKEPNCLVDLATWKTLNIRTGQPYRRLASALDLARAALRRPWALGEEVTTKPSSWVNNLLDDLTLDPGQILPLFITMGRAAFVRAVFRGGTDRLAFTAQLASHLAAIFPEGDRLLQDAVEGADEALGRAANLALVAHELQLCLFERALRRGGWDGQSVIDFDEISTAPYEAARKASRGLRLGLESSDLEKNVAEHASRHSKMPRIGYSADQRRSDDKAVIAHHQKTIEASLAWAERVMRSRGTQIEDEA